MSFVAFLCFSCLLSFPMCYYHHSYSKINVLTFQLEQKIPLLPCQGLQAMTRQRSNPCRLRTPLRTSWDLPGICQWLEQGKHVIQELETCDHFLLDTPKTMFFFFFLRNMIHYDPLDTWINWINDHLDQQWHVNVMQFCFDYFRMMFSSKASSYGILWSKLHFDHLVIWIPSVPSPPGPRVAARTGTIHQRLHGEKEGVRKFFEALWPDPRNTHEIHRNPKNLMGRRWRHQIHPDTLHFWDLLIFTLGDSIDSPVSVWLVICKNVTTDHLLLLLYKGCCFRHGVRWDVTDFLRIKVLEDQSVL